jgi:uncharacterized protein with beta-barrel porin domain
MPVGAGAFLEPFAGISIAKVRLDETPEVGVIQRLDLAAQSDELDTLDLGARGGFAVGTVRIDGRVAATHWFGDRRVSSTLALALAPLQPFAISAAQLRPWAGTASLDATFGLGPVTASIGYSGVFSGASTDQSARATLAVKF